MITLLLSTLLGVGVMFGFPLLWAIAVHRHAVRAELDRARSDRSWDEL